MPGTTVGRRRAPATAMNDLPDDNTLVANANNGDAGAFSALLERHYDLIFRLAFRTLGNQQDAEDITQDICVSLAKKLASFQGQAKFTTWLYQVTLNACRDARRRATSLRKAHSEYGEIAALREANNRQRQRDAQWAYQAIDTLPESLRETALLVVAEGLNHAEVGAIQGIGESTVSWRMHQVRAKLRALAHTEAAN